MKNLSLKWLLVPLMLIFLGIGNARGETYVKSYEDSDADGSTQIAAGNQSSGSAGRVSWSATSATWNNGSKKKRWEWAASSSITFSVSSGYKITQIVIKTSSTTQTISVSPTSTITGNNSNNCTISGINAASVTITVSNNGAYYIKNENVYVYYTSTGSTKTLVYNANGGTGTMDNTTGATVSAASCTFTAPTCKVFDHWNTEANNSGTSYAAGASVATSTTLYAIWRNNPSDPTVTFSNGSYTTGGSALDLSTLFSSNSEGAVTYSITNAGGTGASIAGTSFSATTAGSCTVQASQAADAPCYNAKTATATITVSAPTPATITLQNYDGDATTTGYYSGGSFTLPSENDFVCGDLTFVGWSSVAINDPSATKPASNYYEPGESVTLGASNTFYAVFAESGGAASSSSSISSFEDGTYYMIDSHTYNDVTTYYSPTGTASGQISSVEVTSIVSVTSGVLTLDLTSNLLTNAMKYTITAIDGDPTTYTIYNASTEAYIGANTGTSFTNTNTNKWELITSNKRFMFWYDATTDRAVLYQHSYSSSGTQTYGKRFGCYAKGNAGRTDQQYNKEQYGSGYFFLVPTTGGTSYSNYTTSCVNMRTVYLDAYHFGDTDGAKFAIYSWRNADASDNKLSDAFMTKVEDCYYGHLYEGEMPDNHDRVIFLRNASAAASPVKEGANKLNQTVDITTEANKDFFTIASGGAGNAYTGSWGVYTPNYAVTFSKNGVTTTNTWPSDQCVASGSAATDPSITPLTMGKTFVGWYQEAGGTNAWNFSTTISEATTIYAKWNDVATKTIYLDASATLDGGKTWDADNTVLFVRAYINGTSLGTEIKATAPISSCQPHVYAFTIPGNATHVSFARCATGTTELPASWTNPPVYNQIAGNTVENGKDHYVIDGWGSATLQNSTFTPTSYTISFAAGDYGTGDAPANDSKACGVTYVLPSGQVFSRNGYTMDGWSVNANGSTKDYNLGGNYTTDADQTFYPHWALASYGVTLNTNGGTINAGNVTSYTYGTGATLPTDVTKAHATFQGWYASSTFEGDRVYTIGTTEYGNKQYYAKWEDIKWTVTWKANGETFHTDNNVVDGNTLSAPTPAPGNLTTGSNGCDAEFVGWVLEDNDPGALSISSQSSTPSGLFTTTSPAITANTTFVAIYRQEQ